MKVNQKTLYCQICSQFRGKRHTPVVASDQQIGRGRAIVWKLRAKQTSEHISEAWSDTSWIVEVTVTGTLDTEPFQATRLWLSSLSTTPESLLQFVRNRWSIEGWHWIGDIQLHEDSHCYCGNGPGAPATLRTAVINPLRLAGFQWIRAGMQVVMRDMTALLAMARRQPESATG